MKTGCTSAAAGPSALNASARLASVRRQMRRQNVKPSRTTTTQEQDPVQGAPQLKIGIACADFAKGSLTYWSQGTPAESVPASIESFIRSSSSSRIIRISPQARSKLACRSEGINAAGARRAIPQSR
jgi:hypothetical protein